MLGRGIPVFPGAALLRPQRYVEGGGQQKRPFERVLPQGAGRSLLVFKRQQVSFEKAPIRSRPLVLL